MNAKHFYQCCYVTKARGGKSPLWHARMNDNTIRYTGASSTADGAIKDLRKQVRGANIGIK